MVGKPQSEFTPRDACRAVVRHKGKAFLFFVVAVTAVGAVTLATPKEYRSEGIVFLRLGRENVTLDPTVTMGPETVVAIPQSREAEINSVAEILSSRALLEKVVDAIGPEAILGPDAPQASRVPATMAASAAAPAPAARDSVWQTSTRWINQVRSSAGLAPRERAVLAAFKGLHVEPMRKSNLISVSYKAHSPELAQTFVSKMLDLYQDQHLQMNRTKGAYEFLSQEAARLREKLTRSEQELIALKNATGLADPAEQQKLLLDRIAALESSLLQTNASVAVAEAKVVRMRELLASQSPSEVSSRTEGRTNEGTDSMRAQLYALQVKELEASSKYTDDHPLLKEIRRQAAEAKAILDQEEKTRTEVTVAPGRGYEQVRLALLTEEPALQSLQAQAQKLEGQLAEERGHLRELNENQVQVARLTRDLELDEANYRKYAMNLEQARIDQEMERQRISNIKVVQPATFEPKPVGPRVLVNLALGLMVGTIGALGLALAAEYMDHSFKTPDDIESRLEVPALASVPCLKRRQLVLNGKNRH